MAGGQAQPHVAAVTETHASSQAMLATPHCMELVEGEE